HCACGARRSDDAFSFLECRDGSGSREGTMMNFDGMMGSGMWGMSLFGLLVLVVVVLGIAALIKYLRR
ncbi:hypothetical protein, partial [Xanthobacter autotrophicus]|uniref:hypothetical protein n=1 Tax=Xanthobacter autotrophicus TaxID=280 RepID=UPI00372CCB52